MGFTIDKKVPFGAGASFAAERNSSNTFKSNISPSSTSDIISLLSNDKKSSTNDAAVIETKKTSSISATPPGVSGFIDTAKQAISDITELRAKQKELAYEASTISQGQRSADIQTESESIQDEIDRVAAAATYNGQNVLQGGTFGTAKDGKGVIVGISSAASLIADRGLDLSNPTSAASAYTTISQIAVSGAQFGETTSSALSSSQSDQSTATTAVSSSNEKLTNIDDAEELAKKVASDLTSRFSSVKTDQADVSVLINSIKPDRVIELLK